MQKHNWVNLTLDVVGIILLSLVFNYTSPTDLDSLGVFLVFVLIYLVVFGVLGFVWGLYKQLALDKKITTKEYARLAILAILPMLLLILRSMGPVNLVMAAVMTGLVVLATIFIPKLS